MYKLELILFLNRNKSNEFTQSLQILKEKIAAFSSSYEIIVSEDGLSFHLKILWESEGQMHQAIQSEEFKILSGAINSLCDKTIIRLNDRVISKHISKLKTL